MTEQQIKQQLGCAYISAIAAQAGVIYRDYQGIDYGFDGKFSEVTCRLENGKHRFSETGFGIDFQLKSTINIIPKNGYLFYDLESKNYNDLVEINVGTPRILIVYLMPRERKERLEVLNNHMIIRNCAWWCSLKGLEHTKNKKSKKIKIPESNMLTVKELQRLISCVNKGEEL